MIKKSYLPKIFSYLAGSTCWLILLGILKSSCIINIPLYIDSLWLKPLGDDLVKNLIGDKAFRVKGCGCEDKIIFVSPYYFNSDDDSYRLKNLTSIVDITSWRKTGSDTVSTTYTDNFHKYILFQNSDGISMKVYKK